MDKKNKIKIVVFGIILVIVYIILYFTIRLLASDGECWECMFVALLISLPCWIINSILPGGKNIIVCNVYNILGWFLVGLLIGYFKYKNKKGVKK